jgi:hypothetical protein
MVKKTLLAALLVAAATIPFAPVTSQAQMSSPGIMTGRGDNQLMSAGPTKKAGKRHKAKKKAKKAKKVKKAKKKSKKK